MVSAMILLLGSQMQMQAQRRCEQDFKRPGMEMQHKSCRPMNKKAICQGDVARLQEFYKRKYNIRLSKAEAERILAAEMRDRRDYGRHHDRPHMKPDMKPGMKRPDDGFAHQGPPRRK